MEAHEYEQVHAEEMAEVNLITPDRQFNMELQELMRIANGIEDVDIKGAAKRIGHALMAGIASAGNPMALMYGGMAPSSFRAEIPSPHNRRKR